MVDLLPCPFCGGTPEVVDLCGWEILCRDCGASMCDSDDASREGAIAAWNRRTSATGSEPHRHFWIRHSATHYTCRDCGEPMFPPSGPTAPATDGHRDHEAVKDRAKLLLVLTFLRRLRQWDQMNPPMTGDHAHWAREIDALLGAANQPREIRAVRDRLRAALASVVNHWREFGPEHGFDEQIERVAAPALAGTAETGTASLTVSPPDVAMIGPGQASYDLSAAVPADVEPVTTDDDAPEAIARAAAAIDYARRAAPASAALAIAKENERALDEVLSERDKAHELLDRFAAALGAMAGEHFGEHSSGNDPWMNALEWAETEGRASAETTRAADQPFASRSVQRRIALQKGEPMPTFDGDADTTPEPFRTADGSESASISEATFRRLAGPAPEGAK